MHNKSSNKVPVLLAVGAIGGAVGYLFFTDSGRRKLDSVSRFRVDATNRLPEKIERARQFVEANGRNVNAKVQAVVDLLKIAVDAGQRSRDDATQSYRSQLEKLHRTNQDVVANLHRTVDNLGKLMETAQNTLMSSFHEAGALARGVEGGFRKLAGRSEKPISYRVIG